MEELKLLIEMVKDLPALAVWVLLGYLIFKLTVVGSIFGIIRLAILKLHNVLTGPKEYKLKYCSINREVSIELEKQIARLPGISSAVHFNYIFSSDVQWLREAIDAKLEQEKK